MTNINIENIQHDQHSKNTSEKKIASFLYLLDTSVLMTTVNANEGGINDDTDILSYFQELSQIIQHFCKEIWR